VPVRNGSSLIVMSSDLFDCRNSAGNGDDLGIDSAFVATICHVGTTVDQQNDIPAVYHSTGTTWGRRFDTGPAPGRDDDQGVLIACASLYFLPVATHYSGHTRPTVPSSSVRDRQISFLVQSRRLTRLDDC